MRALLLAAFLSAVASAQVCGGNDLSGAYGFQLSGSSSIAGLPKPMAAIGRVVFESGGHINGPHRHLIFVVGLVVLGSVVAYQVNRVRALSRYYERRPLPR